MFDQHPRQDPKKTATEFDQRYPELYHRLIHQIIQVQQRHPDLVHMNAERLDHLADQLIHDSGIFSHMPPGHTRESIRDMVKVLLLTRHTHHEHSQEHPHHGEKETLGGILPLALGLGLLGGPYYPYYPYPYGYGYGGGYPHRHGGHRGGGGHGRGGGSHGRGGGGRGRR